MKDGVMSLSFEILVNFVREYSTFIINRMKKRNLI